MSFKYKQTAIYIFTAVMVVGLAVLSTGRAGAGTSREGELLAEANAPSTNIEENADTIDLGAEADPASSAAIDNETTDSDVATEPVDVPDEEPVDVFGPTDNEEIKALVDEYLDAKLDCDEERLAAIVDDVNAIDITDIQRRTEKIERYDDVTVYTVDGPEENSFIVLIYSKLKISGIDTLSSALDLLYVKPDSDGKLTIYMGEVDEKVAADVRDILSSNTDVIELEAKVNEELIQQIDSDQALLKYYEELSNIEDDEENSEDSDKEE